MKKYYVFAQDANLNTVQLFPVIDEATFNHFLHDYCETSEEWVDPFDKNYRWLKDYELPEYNLPYRSQGWIVRFVEI